MQGLTTPAAPAAFRQRLRRRAVSQRSATSAHTPANGKAVEVAAPAKLEAASRRSALAAGIGALAASAFADRASAVQGLVPGRIPGLSKPDEDGYRTYMRPEGKSGGHGVGWSEIAQYKFDVPPSFDEIPVSIADLGGAELDLRFQSAVEGDIAVLVAPVMRFRDIGFNADVTIEELFEPPALIRGFGPELIAKQIEDDDIVSMEIVKKDGRQYYEYELNSKHLLVSATAYKNRLFILYCYSTPRQWRKARAVCKRGSQADLRRIQKSFYVKTGGRFDA